MPRNANVMFLKKFLKILWFIHLNDNENMPKWNGPNFDRLRPLLSHLNKDFKEAFNPHRFLITDEKIVVFKAEIE
jgi:hypothetical protein